MDTGEDVRRSNSESAVEHACHEDKTIVAPARPVLPFSPNECIARIALASPARHDGADQNRDEDSSQDEE